MTQLLVTHKSVITLLRSYHLLKDVPEANLHFAIIESAINNIHDYDAAVKLIQKVKKSPTEKDISTAITFLFSDRGIQMMDVIGLPIEMAHNAIKLIGTQVEVDEKEFAAEEYEYI